MLLPMLSSQYARADEMDRMKKEYTDYTTTLSGFATEAQRKFSEPLEVSLINVKLLIQDLEVGTFGIKKWKVYCENKN